MSEIVAAVRFVGKFTAVVVEKEIEQPIIRVEL